MRKFNLILLAIGLVLLNVLLQLPGATNQEMPHFVWCDEDHGIALSSWEMCTQTATRPGIVLNSKQQIRATAA